MPLSLKNNGKFLVKLKTYTIRIRIHILSPDLKTIFMRIRSQGTHVHFFVVISRRRCFENREGTVRFP
jgi:hypothetical protein